MLLFRGYLEVPDVNQVQQGLQDVPRDPDCVWREVGFEGSRGAVWEGLWLLVEGPQGPECWR